MLGWITPSESLGDPGWQGWLSLGFVWAVPLFILSGVIGYEMASWIGLCIGVGLAGLCIGLLYIIAKSVHDDASATVRQRVRRYLHRHVPLTLVYLIFGTILIPLTDIVTLDFIWLLPVACVEAWYCYIAYGLLRKL